MSHYRVPLICVVVLLAAGIFLVSRWTAASSQPAVERASLSAIPRPTRSATLAVRPKEEYAVRAAIAPVSVPAHPPPTSNIAPVAGLARTVRVPILMYHHIGLLPPKADIYRTDLTVDPAVFEGHLRTMVAAGYHSISLYDMYDAMETGSPLPDKPVVLTFDDGYRDAYEYAFPLLKKYGYTGTFFLITDPMDQGNQDYLTWAQAEEMSAAGMDLEPHTKDHLDLRNRSWDFLVWQIVGSAQTVSAHSGHPSRFFAYPSGHYDSQVIKLLQQSGFWGAVTTAAGTIHYPDSLYTLTRVRMRRTDSPDSVLAKLAWNF